jgi:hypothetical protein
MAVMEHRKLRNHTPKPDPVWILSGLALASCVGGGGGGGSSGLQVRTDFHFIATGQPSGGPASAPRYSAYAGESSRPVTIGGIEQAYSRHSASTAVEMQYEALINNAQSFTFDQTSDHSIEAIINVDGQSQPLTISLTLSGADRDQFRIVTDGNDLRLESVTGLDYETPRDTGQNNIYDLTATFTASHPSIGTTVTYTENFSLNVLDINEAGFPTIQTGPTVRFALDYEYGEHFAYVHEYTAGPLTFISLGEFIRTELSASEFTTNDPSVEVGDVTFGGVTLMNNGMPMNIQGVYEIHATITLNIAEHADDLVFNYVLGGPEANLFRLAPVGSNDARIESIAALPDKNPRLLRPDDSYYLVETVEAADAPTRVLLEEYQERNVSEYYLYVLDPSITVVPTVEPTLAPDFV